MKREICVRSIILGAVIMLIGLAVGVIVSPPLIAQRYDMFDNDVFDIITCRKIAVVDNNGDERIQLGTTADGDPIIILADKRDKNAITLVSTEVIDSQTGRVHLANKIVISDPQNQDTLGIELTVRDDGHRIVQLYDKEEELGVELFIDKRGNPGISVMNPQSSNRAIILASDGNANFVNISNSQGDKTESAIMLGAFGVDAFNQLDLSKIMKKSGNMLIVNGGAGREAIGLFGTDTIEPMMGIIDRAGNIRWTAP